MSKFHFSLFLIFLTQNIYSFVHQKTLNGDSFAWEKGSNVVLYINTDNSSAISEATILNMLYGAINDWNESSGVTLQFNTTSVEGDQENRNNVFFTNNPLYFSSSSVLAVTENIYREDTGEIIEANIAIKDSIFFSTDPETSPYLGDVLAHEIGHLVGLDHSQMPFSTMFYRLTRGQVTPAFDDQIGKASLYDVQLGGGTITGTIGGGASGVGVFGAEVTLISSLKGRAIATTFSETDGSYQFKGIPLNDTYYIYVGPIKGKEAFSSYYQTSKTDFCTEFNTYQGSFYESCGNSRKGYPQGIALNSSNPVIDTGVVSIRCNLNVPNDYFLGRSQGNLQISNADRNGDSLVGYFVKNELGVEEDVFTIDLSHLVVTGSDTYLDLSLLSQDFQSKVAYEISVTSPTQTRVLSPTIDSDQNPNLNLKGRLLLDPYNSNNNIFTVRVIPSPFVDYFEGQTDFEFESQFFPDFSKIGDERFFYQLIYFVGQENGLNYSVLSHYNYPTPRGNESCMDAQKTYGVKPAGEAHPIEANAPDRKKSSAEANALACGSVDMGSGPPGPGGGNSLFVGLLLSALMALFNIRFQQRKRF